MKPPEVDLAVRIGRLHLRNPVLTASGTFGYGLEFKDFFDAGSLGGVITKGLSLKPRRGNPSPRICETPSGMINAVGLENIGIEAFAADILPELRKLGAAVIVNFFGGTVEEYAAMAGELDGLEGVDALEMNISCPNVKDGGISFGKEPRTAAAVTEAVRARTGKTLIVKLSPASDITAVARAAEGAGADALSCINTVPAMAIDIQTRRPRVANGYGGLSGPAIRPIAVKAVHDVSRAVGIPVIGVGGIASGADAIEFAMAGAAAVQVGTATFANPAAAAGVLAGITEWCAKNGVAGFASLTGSARIGD